MSSWATFLLVAAATTVALTESRVIPAEPVSMMLDAYGNPVVFLRPKRAPVAPYPQRAMMFGYYRPVRRSDPGQATGVFAQGNAVSGEAFFGGMQHLNKGPEPVDEADVSSAEAQAAPEGALETEQDGYEENHDDRREEHHLQEEQHRQEEEQQQHHDHRHQQEEEQHRDVLPPQEQPEPEPIPNLPTHSTVDETPNEAPITEAPSRPKVHHTKKTKKPPVVVEDDYEEDEDEEPMNPFVPVKGNRRQHYPNLNNFFPMVFSFPGVSSRAGSSGSSPPGAVTAIANSYSTGKSGMASSVATAYGGSPNGKKRRAPTSEE